MADDEDKLVTKPFKFVTGSYTFSFSFSTNAIQDGLINYSWYVSAILFLYSRGLRELSRTIVADCVFS